MRDLGSGIGSEHSEYSQMGVVTDVSISLPIIYECGRVVNRQCVMTLLLP